MLTKRLFRFGYQTPAEAERSASYGWDDESSSGLWIMSASDEAAISWGCVVAQRFISSLFESAGQANYSWSEAGFVHWLEADPNALEAAADLPVVEVGTMPNFAALMSNG